MNNKEFVSELSGKLNTTEKETTRLVEKLISVIAGELAEGNSVSIAGFGALGVKKKEERVIINPATQQRMLVPPKLAVNFKPSLRLKDKYK